MLKLYTYEGNKKRARGYMVGTIIAVVIGVAIAGGIAMNSLKKSRQSSEHNQVKKGENVLKISAALLMDKARQSNAVVDLPPQFASGWCAPDPGDCEDCGGGPGETGTIADVQCPPVADPKRFPNHGWVVPVDYGGPMRDVYGKRLGYCAWKYATSYTHTATDPYTSGGDVSTLTSTSPILAVVSAGPNGLFETDCVGDADQGSAKGDDEIYFVNYEGRGSFDIEGMQGYQDCTNGTLPTWNGTQWTCVQMHFDLNGDGNVSTDEDQIVSRMVNCAKCGQLTCSPGQTTSTPALYSTSQKQCVDSNGQSVEEKG